MGQTPRVVRTISPLSHLKKLALITIDQAPNTGFEDRFFEKELSRCQGLEELELQYYTTQQKLKYTFQAISTLKNLKNLKLNFNQTFNLEKNTLKEFGESLEKIQGLEVLDLVLAKTTRIQNEEFDIFCNKLNSLKKLKGFKLFLEGWSFLGGKSLIALCNSLLSESKLIFFDLKLKSSGGLVTDKSMKQIAELLKLSKSIIYFNFESINNANVTDLGAFVIQNQISEIYHAQSKLRYLGCKLQYCPLIGPKEAKQVNQKAQMWNDKYPEFLFNVSIVP